MINASCAACGRIIAFRTSDPEELAECRSCGVWVKRVPDMPGVAASVGEEEPKGTSRTSIRNLNSEETQPSSEEKASATPSPFKEDTATPTASTQLMAPEMVKMFDDIRLTLADLRGGQERLVSKQENLDNGQQQLIASQTTLLKNQDELKSNQKSLQKSQQALQQSQYLLQKKQDRAQLSQKKIIEIQNSLLNRSLDVSSMPLPTAEVPVEEQPTAAVPLTDFPTTPFSSREVPLIPRGLDDLGGGRGIELVPDIPLAPATRSPFQDKRVHPEPDKNETPYVWIASPPDPKVPIEPIASAVVPPPTKSLVQTNFEKESPFSIDPSNELAEVKTVEEPFATYEAPEVEEIEELPDAEDFTDQSPFSIEEKEPESESPFAVSSPEETTTPFVEAKEKAPQEEESATSEVESPFAEASPFAPVKELEEKPQPQEAEKEEKLGANSLEKQIAAAKKAASREPVEKTKSNTPAIILIVLLLGLIAALVYTIAGTGLFTAKPTPVLNPNAILKAELASFPLSGEALSFDGPEVLEAEGVAKDFLASKSRDEALPFILPVEPKVFGEFFDVYDTYTSIKPYFAQALENGDQEVYFELGIYNRPARLIRLLKTKDKPFLVDWKSLVEVEDVTLKGLSEGIIIGGNDIDSGKVRVWLRRYNKALPELDLANWQAFAIHSTTEEAQAIAAIRRNSANFDTINSALDSTQLRHRGRPALQAIVKVKRIIKEDLVKETLARFEITEVLETNWDPQPAPEESLPEPTPTEEKPETEASTEAILSGKIAPAAPAEELDTKELPPIVNPEEATQD